MDETTQSFRFKEGLRAFTVSWIHGHALLPEKGRTFQKNNVGETPPWIKYLKEKPWEKKCERRGWGEGGDPRWKVEERKQAEVSLVPLHFVQALKHFVNFL